MRISGVSRVLVVGVAIVCGGCSSVSPPSSPTSSATSPSTATRVPLAPPSTGRLGTSSCPDVTLPPAATPPHGLIINLSLSGSAVRQGDPISGQLILNNTTNAAIPYHWEDTFNNGVLKDGVFVGGYRGGGTPSGFANRAIGPGQHQTFSFVINSLGCETAAGPRYPLPPAHYQALALVLDGPADAAWYTLAPVTITPRS